MARITTITSTHDQQAAEDEADLQLLSSLASGAPMDGEAALAEHTSQPDLAVPDVLAAALATPVPDQASGLPDYTSMIPPPLTLPVAATVSWPGAEDIAAPAMAFHEDQAAAPMLDGRDLLSPVSFEPGPFALGSPEFVSPNLAEPVSGVAMAEPSSAALTAADVPEATAEMAGPHVGELVLTLDEMVHPAIAEAPLPLAVPLALEQPLPQTLEQPGPVVAPEPVKDNPFAFTPEYIAATALLHETTKHLRSIGAVNILVAGQTGVGKSTLVNSVFGEAFAATAAGSPVTRHAEWFVSDTVPLRILDTRGLEAKDYSVTLNALRAEIDNSRAQHDEKNQLHMAWVCISTPSSRVQDCEVDVVKLLNQYNIPVIIVLTKYDDDEDFPGIVESIVTEKGAQFTAIVAVRALARKTRPAVGLEELVTATFTALPIAHKAAFAAAQKISRDLNRTTAETYVTVAASAAAAASVIPIPFADLATLAPIQASMLVGISNAFGVTLERTQIMQLISTVLGCLAITMAGGWVIGSVLKFIPGPGSLIGAMMNATVAGALTRTLGRTYIRFLYAFLETNRRLPTADEIFDLFPTFYKAGRKTAAMTA